MPLSNRIKDQSRWYPNSSQLGNVPALHLAFKQLLDQHYALADKVNAMRAAGGAGASDGASAPASASTGTPSGTKLLGLSVAPVDVDSLADGATLKFNKANGNFEFV